MSVSPVSSITPMIYAYQPSKKKEITPEHQKIIDALNVLGIESMGDYGVDKILLTNAMNKMIQDKTSSGQSNYIPFQDVMDSLNLNVTGDINKDYYNTIQELDYRISYASDEEEKAYYQNLKDEVDTQYSNYNYQQSRNDLFLGSSQISDLNRYMLL